MTGSDCRPAQPSSPRGSLSHVAERAESAVADLSAVVRRVVDRLPEPEAARLEDAAAAALADLRLLRRALARVRRLRHRRPPRR